MKMVYTINIKYEMKKINRRIYLFWLDNFLISPDNCQ